MTTDPENLPGEDPKLTSLESRLDAARRHEAERHQPQSGFGLTGPGQRTGQQVISMLVGYPLGGGVIGWFLDSYVFGTRPWIMLALLFLSFAAACYQVFKISKQPPR